MRRQKFHYHLFATMLFLSLVLQQCGQPTKEIGNMVASSASERPNKTPDPELSTSYGPFPTSSGSLVTLQQIESRWRANIVQDVSVATHEQDLDVGCAEDITKTLSQLQHQPAEYIKARIHLLSPAQSPTGERAIYLGRLGLRGGMDPGGQEHDTATSIHQAARQGDLRKG